MTKIYIITEGEYSDYRICAVYSKKEQAEEFAKVERGTVEEYELDKPIEDFYYVEVFMHKNGNTRNKPKVEFGGHDDIDFGWFGTTDVIRCSVTCKKGLTDEENIKRAVKIVNERRVQIIEKGIWGDNEKVRELFQIKNGSKDS
jgi:hypothetical protein